MSITPTWNKGAAILAAAITLLVPTWLYAAQTGYTAGLGFEYATGDYGTGIRTDAIYVPFTVSVYPTERIDFSAEIPYVYQSTSAVVAGEFMGMRQGGGMGSLSAVGAMTGSGMGSGTGPTTTASAADLHNSQSGLGDITLRAGYILLPEGDHTPSIRPNVSLKIPTADKNRFLGTGAFDEGVGVELAKWFGNLLTDGEIGYTFQGSSSVLAVKDYLYYNLGIGYQLAPRLLPMFILKGTTPPVEGASARLEARLRVKYMLTEHTGLDAYVAKGIAQASPDYGTGLAVSYDF